MRHRLTKVTPGLLLVAGLLSVTACRARPEGEKAPEPAVSRQEATAGQKVVGIGDRVHVEYVGRLEDGSVFERSQKGAPLVFTVGSGQIKGFFDQAVRGLKLREEKQVTIACHDAYGPRDTTLIRAFSRSQFPGDFVPETGATITVRFIKDKPQQPAVVVDYNTDEIILDLNHPLAGHDLTYTLKVIVIELPDK